jgi:hypothetical protein
MGWPVRSEAAAAWIAGAAAQRVFEGVFDVVFAGIGVLQQQGVGGHQLPGDAEAALDGAVIDKGLLQGVQRRTRGLGGQALDGDDLFALYLEGRIGAGEHRLSIHQHGARAAFRFVAADFGAGQAQVVAQYVGQHFIRRDAGRHRCAINDKLDGLCVHTTSIDSARCQAFWIVLSNRTWLSW